MRKSSRANPTEVCLAGQGERASKQPIAERNGKNMDRQSFLLNTFNWIFSFLRITKNFLRRYEETDGRTPFQPTRKRSPENKSYLCPPKKIFFLCFKQNRGSLGKREAMSTTFVCPQVTYNNLLILQGRSCFGAGEGRWLVVLIHCFGC